MIILITGGIGDAIALESFFSDSMRNNVSKIYLATRCNSIIKELFESLPNYPRLKDFDILWDDFSEYFTCFYYKEEVKNKIKLNGKDIPSDWDLVVDWSLFARFPPVFRPVVSPNLNNLGGFESMYVVPDVLKEYHASEVIQSYNESSFVKYKLCNLTHHLPEKFILICPYTTTHGTPPERNFLNTEWDLVLNYLSDHDIMGVVVGNFEDYVPKCNQLLNLSNKTSVIEAIEIAKLASGYIGVDSFLSVIVTKFLDSENIKIKSINPHCYRFNPIYFMPHKEFSFVVDSIRI